MVFSAKFPHYGYQTEHVSYRFFIPGVSPAVVGDISEDISSIPVIDPVSSGNTSQVIRLAFRLGFQLTNISGKT